MSRDRCDRSPRGWYCLQSAGHPGSCPAWPRWWNVRQWRLDMRERAEVRAWRRDVARTNRAAARARRKGGAW